MFVQLCAILLFYGHLSVQEFFPWCCSSMSEINWNRNWISMNLIDIGLSRGLSASRFFYRATLCQRSIIAVVVGLSVSLSLSVCLSVTSRYCIETSGRIELVLAWRLPSTCFTLHWKERWVSPNTRALPSGTLSQAPDLENFATASRSRCQKLVVVVADGRACWRHQYDNRES